MKIAIPCHMAQITPEEEERLQELFRRFGNARRVQKRSEAYTSKVAEKLKNRFGLDVHKVSAAMFALKVLGYESFSSLKDALLWGFRADEVMLGYKYQVQDCFR